MTRTQIYLTEHQKRILRHIAAERRSNVSDLVREAVDRLIASEAVDWGARFDAFRQGIDAVMRSPRPISKPLTRR